MNHHGDVDDEKEHESSSDEEVQRARGLPAAQRSNRAESSQKVRQVTVAPLIGEAIRRIANEESVSKLFD